jgi:hypothetical protein
MAVVMGLLRVRLKETYWHATEEAGQEEKNSP